MKECLDKKSTGDVIAMTGEAAAEKRKNAASLWWNMSGEGMDRVGTFFAGGRRNAETFGGELK